ncbi:MAG: (Fe-S)-binding protein [Thermodesulfobacteriota bacterium]
MEQHQTVAAAGGLCAKCGACTAACPVFQVTGRECHGGRGKLHLLARLDPHTASAAYAEILSRCLLCGACEAVCPRGLDITGEIVAARNRLSRSAGEHAILRFITRATLTSPLLATGLGALARLAETLPAQSGLRLRLGLPAQKTEAVAPPPALPLDPAAPLLYFAGCVATHLQPEIAAATRSLCRKSGQPAPLAASGQGCCGLPAHAAGDHATAQQLARRNIAAFEGSEAPILVSCASCQSHLASYPALFADDPEWQARATAFAGRLQEFSTFLLAVLHTRPDTAPATPNLEPRQRVLYHDPCHLRFHLKITKAPRQLLGRFPQIELAELPHGPQCCGHGGLFHLAHPALSTAIRDRLLNDAAATGATTVTTTCSGCLLQWQQGLAAAGNPGWVAHLALLLDRLLP